MLLGETNSFTGVKKKRNKEDMSSDKYIYSIDQGWGKDGRILAESFFFLHYYGPWLYLSPWKKQKGNEGSIQLSWQKQAWSTKDQL